MSESKILITNFPNLYQRPTMSALQDAKETINVVCGYDFQIAGFGISNRRTIKIP